MATPLPPRDHRIAKGDAQRIARAHHQNPGRHRPAPFAFRREALERVLAQPGCVGVRLHPALHDDGSSTWVLVGVNDTGNDMTDGELVQEPFPCPPFCPDDPLGGNG